MPGIRITPKDQQLAKGDLVFLYTNAGKNVQSATVESLKRSRRHANYGDIEFVTVAGISFRYCVSPSYHDSDDPMWLERSSDTSTEPLCQVTWDTITSNERRSVAGDYLSCCVAYSAIIDTADGTNVRLNGFIATEYGTYCSECNVHNRWCPHIRPPQEAQA